MLAGATGSEGVRNGYARRYAHGDTSTRARASKDARSAGRHEGARPYRPRTGSSNRVWPGRWAWVMHQRMCEGIEMLRTGTLSQGSCKSTGVSAGGSGRGGCGVRCLRSGPTGDVHGEHGACDHRDVASVGHRARAVLQAGRRGLPEAQSQHHDQRGSHPVSRVDHEERSQQRPPGPRRRSRIWSGRLSGATH